MNSIQKISIAIGLSVALHMCASALLWKLPSVGMPKIQEPAFVELREFRGQIIETADAAVSEPAENTKFLSKQNQSVTREMRAARTGQFTNAAGNGQAGAQSEALESAATEQEKLLDATSEIVQAARDTMAKFVPDLNFAFQSDDGLASATDDSLKDLELGDKTLLNAREFLYHSYFNRIKAQIKGYFEPSMMSKIRQAQRLKKAENRGRIVRMAASIKEKVTKTVIVLDQYGSLVRIQILSSSGDKDLDVTAIEAFEKAKVFPNPPKGMVDEDGLIRIYWDFVLEV